MATKAYSTTRDILRKLDSKPRTLNAVIQALALFDKRLVDWCLALA